MKKMKKGNIAIAVVCLGSIAFGQGGLTPPGTPTPSMKTLQQVEPRIDVATLAGNSTAHYVINQAGSYYLSENLSVTNTTGILINAIGVTLDLNGFEILRTTGNQGGYAIFIHAKMDHTTIYNGSILGGFEYGIYANPSISPVGYSLKDLTVSGCSSCGIFTGSASRLFNCLAHNNTGIGIQVGYGSLLSGCCAHKNQGTYGLYANRGSTLSECTAYDNQGDYGIYAGAGSTLSGCAAHNNQGIYGIYTDPGSTLSGCVAYNNQGKYGIYAGEGSCISECVAKNNIGGGSYTYGIYAENGSTISRCSSHYNRNTNSSTSSYQGTGIFAATGSTVKDCSVNSNQGDGIRVTNDSIVKGNCCMRSGTNGNGAGIHATGQGNQIEANTVTYNDYGIYVDDTQNFISRNTASENGSNWEIASGNACLVIARTSCTTISGNSGGTAPGSTDPNANFTY